MDIHFGAFFDIISDAYAEDVMILGMRPRPHPHSTTTRQHNYTNTTQLHKHRHSRGQRGGCTQGQSGGELGCAKDL